MLNRALFSSVKDDWPTPWEFFHKLDLEFDFTLDVCAVPWSAKVWRYCVPPHALRVWGKTTFRRLFPDALVDGLAHSWAGERCYMNPPYGREIGPWVEKARREGERGALVVGLLPARTDTAWFHEHVYRAATEIRFLKGRLKFEGAVASAPFPSLRAHPDTSGVLADAGLTSEQAAEMYHLLAIARYEDRFVVPTSGRENRDDVWAMKGSEGLAQVEMEERP